MNLLLLQRHDYDTTRGFQDEFFFVYSTVFFRRAIIECAVAWTI